MDPLGFSSCDGMLNAQVLLTLLKRQGLKPFECSRFAARLKPYLIKPSNFGVQD